MDSDITIVFIDTESAGAGYQTTTQARKSVPEVVTHHLGKYVDSTFYGDITDVDGALAEVNGMEGNFFMINPAVVNPISSLYNEGLAKIASEVPESNLRIYWANKDSVRFVETLDPDQVDIVLRRIQPIDKQYIHKIFNFDFSLPKDAYFSETRLGFGDLSPMQAKMKDKSDNPIPFYYNLEYVR